eukprot:7137610-Prymnesium_polylepis.1
MAMSSAAADASVAGEGAQPPSPPTAAGEAEQEGTAQHSSDDELDRIMQNAQGPTAQHEARTRSIEQLLQAKVAKAAEAAAAAGQGSS